MNFVLMILMCFFQPAFSQEFDDEFNFDNQDFDTFFEEENFSEEITEDKTQEQPFGNDEAFDSKTSNEFESFDNFEEELLEPTIETKPEAPKLEALKPQPEENRALGKDKRGRYIYHPNQEKGLYKINKNGEYLYKYEKTELNGFFHLKGGSYSFENFPTEDSVNKFETYYDSETAMTFLLEYDWPIFKNMQSLSLNFNGGMAYARGNGAFIDTSIAVQAREKYSLLFIPLGVGLTYKLKFISNQLFLPYVNGSLNYNLLMEYRESFEAFKYLGVFGAHFSGGVSINLGWFERLASLQLDHEFGINNSYLSVEARQVISFEAENDIGGFVILGGLSFEY